MAHLAVLLPESDTGRPFSSSTQRIPSGFTKKGTKNRVNKYLYASDDESKQKREAAANRYLRARIAAPTGILIVSADDLTQIPRIFFFLPSSSSHYRVPISIGDSYRIAIFINKITHL